MSVQDVIKKSFLESQMFEQAINLSTILTMVVDMLVALAAGLIIYTIYKKFFSGVIFSKSFAITLVGMTVLTSMVTLAISTNVVISLGMVGALSIVRFRTAIKEPLDLLYLFWAITTGITIGASMYILACIGMIVVFLLLMILLGKKSNMNSYIMIVHYIGDKTSDDIEIAMGKTKYIMKSKIMRKDEIELTLQVTGKSNNMLFAEKVKELEFVKDVSLLQFDGEYHG